MKISYDEENNSAIIELSDADTSETIGKYKYLTYKLDNSGDVNTIEISDVKGLGIDIVRITYMTPEQVLDYLEEIRETG